MLLDVSHLVLIVDILHDVKDGRWDARSRFGVQVGRPGNYNNTVSRREFEILKDDRLGGIVNVDHPEPRQMPVTSVVWHQQRFGNSALNRERCEGGVLKWRPGAQYQSRKGSRVAKN